MKISVRTSVSVTDVTVRIKSGVELMSDEVEPGAEVVPEISSSERVLEAVKLSEASVETCLLLLSPSIVEREARVKSLVVSMLDEVPA